jgi:hypothetical protein
LQKWIVALMPPAIVTRLAKAPKIPPKIIPIMFQGRPFFPPALCCGTVSGVIVSVEFEVVGALVALTFGACASAAVGRCKLKRCLA